ncbi:MAG: site-2 protease family protein [Planctomycetota bacterium]
MGFESQTTETDPTGTPTPPPADAPPVRLDADVTFQSVEIGGVLVHRAEHHGTGQYFQFGAAEYHVACLLDGESLITDIVARVQSDGLDWTPEDVADFIGILVTQKLAVPVDSPVDLAADTSVDIPSETPGVSGSADDTPPPLESLPTALPFPPKMNSATSACVDIIDELPTEVDEAGVESLDVGEAEPAASDLSLTQTSADSNPSLPPSPNSSGPSPQSPNRPSPWHGVLRVVSWLISVKWPLGPAAPLANWLYPNVRLLFHRRVALFAVAGVVASMTLAATQRDALFDELMRIFDSQMWLWMLVTWAVMKVIHEMGHATAARHHGVRVGRGGVMFFMMAPLAYVDVTDAWALPRRLQRVQIAMAGVYFELIMASVAIWVWWCLPVGLAKHFAAQVFFLAGPATLLVNANPLLRLDGYYVLADWWDIPNLRSQGRQLVNKLLHRKIFGITKPDVPLSGWRRPAAASHAVASMGFQIVWMSGMVVGVSLWAGPIGLAMSAAALVLWLCVPTIRWAIKLWNHVEPRENFSLSSHRRRVAWSLLTVVLLAQFFLSLPSPLVRQIPAVVQFAEDQYLRAPADGFVRRVHFRCGDRVDAGQVIMELAQPELELRLWELRRDLQSASILWQQQENAGSLGLAEATRRRIESLRTQEAELSTQWQSMNVTAEISGTILTPDLDAMQDRFVKTGDLLVHIGTPERKELVLSVADSDVDAYASARLRNHAQHVFFRTGDEMSVRLSDLRPSASLELPHPALGAISGGPLPVEPSSDAEGQMSHRLLDPHFSAVVPLPITTARAVHAGQIAQVALQDQRSIASRLWDWIWAP